VARGAVRADLRDVVEQARARRTRGTGHGDRACATPHALRVKPRAAIGFRPWGAPVG
jgi:hypothetical protein